MFSRDLSQNFTFADEIKKYILTQKIKEQYIAYLRTKVVGARMIDFTDEMLERYNRHIILSDLGIEGQQRIIKGRVLIVGVGGLGSPAALYLTAAGVGTIGLADGDDVSLSNLQRQIIHFTNDVGKPKILSAKEKLEMLNPGVKVITHHKKVSAETIECIIKDYDFVIDCTDNFPSKFLINDACVFGKKPFSHGGVLGFDGQAMTYVPGTACYRCFFDGPPAENAVPEPSKAGILGAVPGVLGTIQAAEAIKYLINKGNLLTNRLLILNLLSMDFRCIDIRKNKKCPVCGEKPIIAK